jgi:hypothetical protein
VGPLDQSLEGWSLKPTKEILRVCVIEGKLLAKNLTFKFFTLRPFETSQKKKSG